MKLNAMQTAGQYLSAKSGEDDCDTRRFDAGKKVLRWGDRVMCPAGEGDKLPRVNRSNSVVSV